MAEGKPVQVNPLELPELTPAFLDAAAVERFFTDVAFETKVHGILLRGDGIARADAAAPNLRAARDALLGKAVTSIQVHYTHAGVERWDTLLSTDAGVRIVRVRK